MAIVAVIGRFRGAAEDAVPNSTMAAIYSFMPVALVASTVCILIDLFVVPRLGLRRLVPLASWLLDLRLEDLLRVLLLPISLVIGKSVTLAAEFVRPRQVDSRFQRELKGVSSIWASMGFLVAIYLLYSRANGNELDGRLSLWGPSFSNHSLRNAIPDTVDGLLGDADLNAVATPKPSIYSGANYAQYSELIAEYAKQNNIRTDLFFALVAEESNFDPNFRGVEGGVGLLNVTSGMAKQVGVDNYLSPAGNLEAGALVLKSLIELFGEDNPGLSVAAYHFGTKRIQDNPALVKQDPDIRGFVEAVMRKVDAS